MLLFTCFVFADPLACTGLRFLLRCRLFECCLALQASGKRKLQARSSTTDDQLQELSVNVFPQLPEELASLYAEVQGTNVSIHAEWRSKTGRAPWRQLPMGNAASQADWQLLSDPRGAFPDQRASRKVLTRQLTEDQAVAERLPQSLQLFQVLHRHTLSLWPSLLGGGTGPDNHALWPARAFGPGETVLTIQGKWTSLGEAKKENMHLKSGGALLLEFTQNDGVNSTALALPGSRSRDAWAFLHILDCEEARLRLQGFITFYNVQLGVCRVL